MRYADAAAVAAGFRTLTDEEQARADALLEEAAVLIDAVAADAKEDAKWVVSCRMVRRVLGDGTGGGMPLYPMGASQGSATALGYTQSWTMSGGTSGELYISRTERRLLGAGNRIGAHSPLEAITMIKGIDVTLYERTQTGEDDFGAAVYSETPVTVHNVLVGEPETADLVNELQLYGKRLAYVLAIPKGDTHDWEGAAVAFFGQKFRAYGSVTQGMEAMIPLRWNKKVKVERYE